MHENLAIIKTSQQRNIISNKLNYYRIFTHKVEMTNYFITTTSAEGQKLYVHFDPRSGYRVSDIKIGAVCFTLENAHKFMEAVGSNVAFSTELVHGSVKSMVEDDYDQVAMKLAKATFDNRNK